MLPEWFLSRTVGESGFTWQRRTRANTERLQYPSPVKGEHAHDTNACVEEVGYTLDVGATVSGRQRTAYTSGCLASPRNR